MQEMLYPTSFVKGKGIGKEVALITDGRVLGKMGHSERIAPGIYRNVPGEYDIRMFEAAVKYFKG